MFGLTLWEVMILTFCFRTKCVKVGGEALNHPNWQRENQFYICCGGETSHNDETSENYSISLDATGSLDF